jgi:hypothetical protein
MPLSNRPATLWLASYPRSGNTFLRLLLRSRYAISSGCSEWKRKTPPPRNFSKSRYFAPDYSSSDEPVVPNLTGMKTHGLPTNDTDPAVYIVRDGRDSLVSYAYYILTQNARTNPDKVAPADVVEKIRELIPIPRLTFAERIRNYLRGGSTGYGTWSQNVDAWTRRPNTVVIRFEDLVARPGAVADQVIADLGLDLAVVSEEIPSFQELNSASKSFFRKGTKGSWGEVFTSDLHELFWKHHGATMRRLGYSFDDPRKAAA